MISATDIIRQSKSLYKENFGTFLKYFILSIIATFLGQAVLAGSSAMGSMALVIVGIVFMIIAMLVQFWVRITFSKVIAQLDRGVEDQGIKSEMGDSKSVFWRAVGVLIWVGILAGWPTIVLTIFSGILQIMGITSLWTNILIGILGIVGVIYTIYMTNKLIFAYFGVVVDKMGIQEAVEFSKEKVSGNWWAILWRLIAPGVGIALMLFIVNLVLGGGAFLVGNEILMMLVGFILFVISFLAIPIFKSIPVVLYNDLKSTSSSTEKQTREPTEKMKA